MSRIPPHAAAAERMQQEVHGRIAALVGQGTPFWDAYTSETRAWLRGAHGALDSMTLHYAKQLVFDVSALEACRPQRKPWWRFW
jgi:hypothetical protein